MLWEEFEVFAKNDTDIGNVNHKKLKIGIKYNIPYQAASNSISRPVYQELNYYLCPRSTEYTLDYQQSSRVVAVMETDETLRLCCDYRMFNAKTMPVCHPPPCIQGIIDNLGKNQYFNFLY